MAEDANPATPGRATQGKNMDREKTAWFGGEHLIGAASLAWLTLWGKIRVPNRGQQ
jgi:hypothetical protein